MQTTKDIFWGAHTVTILDPENGFLPYQDGMLEIIGSVENNFSYENVPLNGGSSSFPFASETGAASSEISMVVRQANRSMFETFAGGIATETAGSTTGTVGTLVNTKGTSVVATTGIDSVSALSGSEANLKNGLYMVKVVTSTTVNIYAATNVDLLTGTDVEFQDTSYKLLASNLTITQSSDTDVTSLGIKLTGDSGTIGMTVGDVAMFEVSRAHDGLREYSVGGIGQVPPYVGLYFVSAPQGDGTVTTIFFPKVKFAGLPLNFTEKQFSEFTITGTCVRDTNPFNTSEEIVYKLNHVKGNG